MLNLFPNSTQLFLWFSPWIVCFLLQNLLALQLKIFIFSRALKKITHTPKSFFFLKKERFRCPLNDITVAQLHSFGEKEENKE